MAEHVYEMWSPRDDALQDVARANVICRDYRAQGFDLTLRQLYYQFVARAWIPNTERSYKRLGDIVNRARMAGMLDWDYIVDRTRNLMSNSHWTTPGSIISSAAYSYRLDRWVGQSTRVEVWVEKEALAGIVGQVAGRWDVPYFSCRGYVSQSEMRAAGVRIRGYLVSNRQSPPYSVRVLYLGDHDPSGIDMSRDVEDRLLMFSGIRRGQLTVERIALNMDQVEQYNPPPNPTKLTDSRSTEYVNRYGMDCWELDALDPATLSRLIEANVLNSLTQDLYEDRVDQESTDRQLLTSAANRWPEVASFLS